MAFSCDKYPNTKHTLPLSLIFKSFSSLKDGLATLYFLKARECISAPLPVWRTHLGWVTGILNDQDFSILDNTIAFR
jgi:hypothetical protein